jgi:two-component system chemotaxis response regulator CheY
MAPNWAIAGEVSTMAVRVMIVDDSVSIRDVLRLDLESLGCDVVAEAENASQALDLFRTVNPDVVTLDVLMPRVGGMDSLDFFRILRKEAPSVPVIIVSVVADPEIRTQFMDGGALEYVLKPFNPKTFQQIRERLMERFPAMRRREITPRRRYAVSDGSGL